LIDYFLNVAKLVHSDGPPVPLDIGISVQKSPSLFLCQT
jgi:hypothetical protein